MMRTPPPRSANPARLVFATVCVVAAAACGGGGSGSGALAMLAAYRVGGSVSGLEGPGLVLRNNGGDSLSISSNGTFTFPTPVAGGKAYQVTVATEPAEPIQACDVVNGAGTSDGSAVTTVVVTCATAALAAFAGPVAAADPTLSGSADGIGAAARFSNPGGMAADIAGNVYVADFGNDTIRQVTPTGIVSTLAGQVGTCAHVDGAGAAARVCAPSAVAIDKGGDLYVVDGFNTIRKIVAGGTVSTFAGAPYLIPLDNFCLVDDPRHCCLYADGTAADARFCKPSAVAVDAAGNVYVADSGNNAVRRITPGGLVATLAGSPDRTASADGVGSSAGFAALRGMVADATGNLYGVDADSIRKITLGGLVTTLAGVSGSTGDQDGIGAAARFDSAADIAIGRLGDLYVADWGNDKIRKVTPAGAVTSVVGVHGQQGFTAGALPGVVSHPRDLTVSGTSLYITVPDYNGIAVVTSLE
jgi:hypothetical protein